MADDGGPKTLRDEFAMAALNGLVQSDEGLFTDTDDLPWKGATKTRAQYRREQIERLTKDAYAMADAMLACRLKSRDPDNPLWEPEHKET